MVGEMERMYRTIWTNWNWGPSQIYANSLKLVQNSANVVERPIWYALGGGERWGGRRTWAWRINNKYHGEHSIVEWITRTLHRMEWVFESGDWVWRRKCWFNIVVEGGGWGWGGGRQWLLCVRALLLSVTVCLDQRCDESCLEVHHTFAGGGDSLQWKWEWFYYYSDQLHVTQNIVSVHKILYTRCLG